jgi:dolichyl-diphosphooligosaccharide---protein glycosyltransferase
MAPAAPSVKKSPGPKGVGPSTATAPSASSSSSDEFNDWVWLGVVVYAVFVVCRAAYQIRLFAINEYGPVIHEFDPYFNFRATEVCRQ